MPSEWQYKDRKYRWPARVNGGRFHRLGRTMWANGKVKHIVPALEILCRAS
jgi:hypothetical protein